MIALTLIVESFSSPSRADGIASIKDVKKCKSGEEKAFLTEASVGGQNKRRDCITVKDWKQFGAKYK